MSKATRSKNRKGLYARNAIIGTPDRPRLSVYRSNANIYAQIIDDIHGHTLVSTSSLKENISEDKSKMEVSKRVGESIAEKAKDAGITKVVFDRNGYRYHGRVRALAEGAREGGLEF